MLKICDIDTIDLLIDKIQNIEKLTISTHPDGKTYVSFEFTDVELPKKDCTIELLSRLHDIKKGMYISTIVNFTFKYDYEFELAIGNITYKKVDKIEEMKKSLDEINKYMNDNNIVLNLWSKNALKQTEIPTKKKGNPMRKVNTEDVINLMKEGLDSCH